LNDEPRVLLRRLALCLRSVLGPWRFSPSLSGESALGLEAARGFSTRRETDHAEIFLKMSVRPRHSLSRHGNPLRPFPPEGGGVVKAAAPTPLCSLLCPMPSVAHSTLVTFGRAPLRWRPGRACTREALYAGITTASVADVDSLVVEPGARDGIDWANLPARIVAPIGSAPPLTGRRLGLAGAYRYWDPLGSAALATPLCSGRLSRRESRGGKR
jgi:hypothetical protein